MRDVAIAGIGSWLPETAMTNVALFEKMHHFEKDRAALSLEKKGTDISTLSDAELFDKWVQQVTGIVSRPWLRVNHFENNENIDIEIMGKFAAERALQEANILPSQVNHIIFSTYTGGMAIPGPAAQLVDLLQINTSCSAFTLNSACDGFVQAFINGYIRVASGYDDVVLIVASEKMSDKMDFNDPTTSILFGDGAGAVVLTAGKKQIFGAASEINYSNEHIRMTRGGNISMGGGPLVQRSAVNAMSGIAEKALAKSNMKMSDIKQFVPHQANIRILQALEKKLELSPEQVLVKSLPITGNLSSATVPVAMDLFRKGTFPDAPYTKGAKTVLCSVGGGYSYSGVVVEF